LASFGDRCQGGLVTFAAAASALATAALLP